MNTTLTGLAEQRRKNNAHLDNRDAYLDKQYEEALMDKPVEDFASGTTQDQTTGNSRAAQAAMQSAQNAAGAGNTAGTAGGALMMTGNPVGVGVGAGLMTIGAIQKSKAAKENARVQREQARIERQQQALSRMMGLSDSMRRL